MAGSRHCNLPVASVLVLVVEVVSISKYLSEFQIKAKTAYTILNRVIIIKLNVIK